MVAKRITAKRFALVIALVMLMMTALGSMTVSYATLTSIPAAVQTGSVSSSKVFKDEYYKVTTPLDENKVVYVEGKTKITTKRFCIRMKRQGDSSYAFTVFVTPNKNGEFKVKINTAKGNKKPPQAIKGTVAGPDASWDTCPGYKAIGTMKPGTYHLTIARAKTSSEANISKGVKWYNGVLGGSKGYAYKETVLTIKEGQSNNPKVVKYSKAITNNNNVRNLYEKKSYHDSSYKGSYVRYMDTYLKDLSYLGLKNPGTGKVEAMTSSKVKYLKGVADSVTKGADTNYEKLAKIYEYVGSNFYYDVLANEQFKNQYANPYTNIYNLRNKVSSKNSKSGKVATTCQGYAAMVIALARCEGIPARPVSGQHISQPLLVWGDISSSQIQKVDHWWAEAWADGRWVVIDACSASNSKWNRSYFGSSGTWTKGADITYAHFDPSPEQLSNSFAYIGVYPGSTDGKYINRATEVKQLRAFLNTKSNGKTNGKRLNSKYSSTNFATWGTTASDDFLTDGYGRVTHILWGDKGLTGKMNLDDFSKLKYLTVYNNKISSLTLDNCSSLESVSATYTKITKFDSTNSKNLAKISAKGNKLTSARFINKGYIVAIKSTSGGSFAFDYNKSNSKKLTIYAGDPKPGYKYAGIYHSSGKKLTSGKSYYTNPSGTYTVKFVKK